MMLGGKANIVNGRNSRQKARSPGDWVEQKIKFNQLKNQTAKAQDRERVISQDHL